MAVEIPVVIDIDKAFDDAARRVDSAMRPLQREIEDSTANLKLKIGVEYDPNTDSMKRVEKTLEQLTTTYRGKNGHIYLGANMDQLLVALDDAKKKYMSLTALEEKGANVNKQRLNDYRDAIVVLTAEIEQRQHAVNLVSRETEKIIQATRAEEERNYILQQDANTLSEMNARLDALRGKLNNLDPKSNEWTNTAKEVKKATAELQKYDERLRKILDEKPKSGSIDKINKDMQALINQWNAMSKAQKFDKDGNLKASAQKVIEKYRALTEEARKYGVTLEQYVGAGTAQLQKQQGVLTKLLSTFGAYISIHSLLRFVKGIRDVTAELEFQRIALGRLLQDVSYGNYLFEQIKRAAVESPFRIKDLVTYTKQLAAYRVEQENLFDTTKRLADISAGLGVDMNRLILAYGQVRAASVLRGQELRQFTEAGIPLVELLAEKFTDLRGEMVSTGDVFKLISERAVPFSMISDIFEDLTEKGGMFYKMQEEQAKTLKGRWEKLKDAYDIALQSVGDTTTFQRMNDIVLGGLTKAAGSLRVIVKLVDAATWSFAAYNAVVLITSKRVQAVATAEQAAAIAEALRTKNVNKLIGKIMGQAAAEQALTAATTQATIGTNALSRALGRLKIAILTNPWAVAGAAILGVVLALTRFKKAADDYSDAINTMNRAADELHTESRHQERIKGLIEQYEKLTAETERNAAQNETLARTMKKLSDEFPEYKDRINDSNLPLEDRLKLVKDLNEEEEKRLSKLKSQKEEELKANETKLSYATTDLDAAEQAKDDATKYYNELQARLEELAQSGKKGRGWFSKFMFGANEYDDVYAALVRQRQILDESEAAYNKTKESVDGLTDAVGRLKTELYGSQEEGTKTLYSWKAQLEKMQNSSMGFQLFTPEQLEGWHRLYDVSTDLEKEWKRLKEDISALEAGLENARKAGSNTVGEWQKDLDEANDKFAGLEFIREFFHFVWGKKEKQPRDTRLSDLKKDISEVTNAYKKFLELRKYMSESRALIEIDKLFPQLKGWKPSFDETIKKLQQMRDDVAVKLARSPKDKTLLDMQRALDTEISNLKFDDLKKKTDDELNRLSDEIKRSETARNFYKNILDMTGDEELAANMTVSVYGDVGKEFKDRMQQQLDAAFQSLDWSELPDDVFGQLAVAVSNQDFNAILDKLELFPEEWQKVLKQMASDNEKYNADYLSNLYKTYQKAKTFDQRRQDIRNREAQKRAEIEANTSLTDEQKAEFTAASRTKEAKDLAKINVEELKNTYEWTKAFEDLDRVGSVTLVNLREKIEAIIEAQKDILTPEDLKALTEALTKIRDTQTQRDPITAFASSGRKAALLAPAVFSKQGSKAYDKAIEKIKKFNEQAKETDKIDLDHLQDAFTASVDDIEKGAEAVANYASQWKGVIDTISDVFELDEIPILGETIDGVSSALGVVAAIIPVITVETTALSAAANSIPFVAILTAIVATLGAIIGMIKGIINAKVERLNQKIETQKEYVNDLERAYDRLGKAIEKSFGTDYIENYRKSLENLAAQQAAYQEQARLEREKGKKSDEKKAREYEEAAVDVTEKIEDAQGQIAEFFAGTDLTSAAKDFASAWLDAYREFGSITTAMKEKFQDMLGEMVENAMFAQLAQTILRPFYDEINRRADDGQLSAKDVADIASMVPDYIESLNGAFTVAANQLQAYGYNLRETAGTMTGISRSIAGASEESINGLAAGINTQNFYMQHIDANVALILSSLTGGTTTAGASVTGEVVDPYKDVVLKNVAFIPTIDRNLAELLAEVRKVIKPRDAARSSSHVLVTNL